MTADAPETIAALEADIGRLICLRVWGDAPCNFEVDGPCGRCGPGARAAVASLISTHQTLQLRSSSRA
jgi:hypothetical protein